MPNEQLVIYLIAAAFALIQFLAGALKRRRESEMAQPQSPPEPVEEEPAEPWWDQVSEAPAPAVRKDAALPPAERRPPAPEPSPARPGPRRPIAPSRQAHPEPASQHRLTLKDRAELRRAVELMAILGPPRSRAPDDF